MGARAPGKCWAAGAVIHHCSGLSLWRCCTSRAWLFLLILQRMVSGGASCQGMEGDALVRSEQQRGWELGQPGSSRSSPTALARREQMSHGPMLQQGKCLVQKAPTLILAWEQQGFHVKHAAATGKGCEGTRASSEHRHSMTIPGRGQGGTLPRSSLPSSADWSCWDTPRSTNSFIFT